MLYPCICNVVISCWKSGAYDSVICRGGTDMCFVPGFGWKHLDLEQYRISSLTTSPRLMFLSLKLVIGGHEPTIMHNTPSWSHYLLLGQSNKQQQRTCKNYSRT